MNVVSDEQCKTIESVLGIDMSKRIGKNELRSGYPPERVVYIDSFRGQEGHSLIAPYEEALRKFS